MMSAVNLENVGFYQPSEPRRNGKNRPVFAKADVMSKAEGRAPVKQSSRWNALLDEYNIIEVADLTGRAGTGVLHMFSL
jgi:hypothetical protein